MLNVAPALESITNHIFEMSKEISCYKICEGITVNLSSIGKEEWTVDNGNTFSVEVVDSVQDYLELMEEVFDFSKLKQFFTAENAPKILLNAMNGGM